MKRSDISTLQVLEACEEAFIPTLRGSEGFRFPLDLIIEKTEAPFKVALAAMKREDDRGLITYGVSLRSAFLTDEGRAKLAELRGDFRYGDGGAMKGKIPLNPPL